MKVYAQLPGIIAEQNQGQTNINGAGATFPFPLIDTWRVEYQKIKPDVNINYQSTGSGGGVKQFTTKTVDFGASDVLSARRSNKKFQALYIYLNDWRSSCSIQYTEPSK